MADEDTPPRQMSLIPYASDAQEIVLRRGNAVVVYDAPSRQLLVRNASEKSLDLGECPTCHRPYREDTPRDSEEHERHLNSERHFVDPEYFGLLAASQRPTPNASGTTTPSRRLFQPALRSGRSRDVSGTSGPPAESSFLSGNPSAARGEGIASSAFNDGHFKTFFVEKEVLGKGGSGIVLLVEHVMASVPLGHYACKRVPVGDDHAWLEKVLMEVKLLHKILHPNLVRYHWVWLEHHQQSPFGPSVPCLWILQEYCNGGDLHNLVLGPKEEPVTKEKLKQRMRRRSRGDPPELSNDLRSPSKLTFEQIASFFKDITTGLHHLHTQGYVHRDLKPSNCLLQRSPTGKIPKVLISDFGEVQAAGAKRGSTGATGTISYCAPEVLRKDGPDGVYGDFTSKSDIWSLGMIVYFMAFGHLPYSNADGIAEEDEDLDELRAEIECWPGFDDGTRTRADLPKELYKFLKRLLSADPNERPSTEEILSSIKAGAPLGEAGPAPTEDGIPRVLSMDMPGHRPSPQTRRQSAYTSKQGLASLARESSGENRRSQSPAKQRLGTRSEGHSRPTSPLDSSVVIRPRKIELPPTSDTPPPQQSPRLALPAPPASPQRPIVESGLHILGHPTAMLSIRTFLFAVKVLSLFLPCSPYAARSWVLYPLLGLAALDMGILRFGIRQSLLILGVHFAAVIVAYQHGCLCERPAMVWEDP